MSVMHSVLWAIELTCLRERNELAVLLTGLFNQSNGFLDRLLEVKPPGLGLDAGSFILANGGRHVG